ncbi:MAG TPA: hypothetical protein PLO37_08545 [Candidatus Hydrogenedentes bacterium]|nr:hypothetical protein [Candidatus Hydrogenedentota bacterium]HPG66881.1 hypothetical protein [Candidatus Hydrogenedentota bacterium]
MNRLSLVLQLMFIASWCAGADAADVAFEEARHVCVRGEQCHLRLAASKGDTVGFAVDGYQRAQVPIQDGAAVYTIDTRLLRAGDYTVTAEATAGGQPCGEARFPLTVARAFDTERMPVWRWGGGGSDMPWWMARGFTGGWLSSYRDPTDAVSADTVSHARHTMDDATRYDFDLGLYFHTLLSDKWNDLEDVKAMLPDGSRSEKVYPLEPEVVDYTKTAVESWMNLARDYPGLRHVMLDSEWQTPYCVNEAAAALCREETGLDIREFVVGKGEIAGPATVIEGIIEDDNPRYRFLQWWWQRGHGMAPLNEIQNEIVKRHRPDLITWHEPYRLAPVRHSHKGLDCIGTWTYGAPDIKRLCYTTYLQAAARPEQQLVHQDITLFVYARFVMPLDESTADLSRDFSGKDPYFTAGPDYAREAMWLVLSQRPDILCFYSGGSLSPTITTLDPHFSSPETYDAIGEVCAALVKPYGPAILASKRVAPRVALLMSAASTWFRASDWLSGYENEKTLPYATLLMRNHVPFDVLLDEDILEGALDRYEVLVMPKADTLLRSEHARICAFAQKGGRVIANNELRAAIPGAAITEFDFGHWNRIAGTALATGDAVTAEEDREIMERYARDLAPLLEGVTREAAAASPRVLVNSLDAGDARYHFFINDDQTYGPRFGHWKLRFELGVAQTADLRVALDGRPVLYDALAHVPVTYEEQDGVAVFTTRLPAARGKLIAALPEPIGSVAITAPERANAGEDINIRIQVVGESGKPFNGALPLKIEVTDPAQRPDQWGRYTATRDGVCTFRFIAAANDAPGTWKVRVVDLIAGKEAIAGILVEN